MPGANGRSPVDPSSLLFEVPPAANETVFSHLSRLDKQNLRLASKCCKAWVGNLVSSLQVSVPSLLDSKRRLSTTCFTGLKRLELGDESTVTGEEASNEDLEPWKLVDFVFNNSQYLTQLTSLHVWADCAPAGAMLSCIALVRPPLRHLGLSGWHPPDYNCYAFPKFTTLTSLTIDFNREVSEDDFKAFSTITGLRHLSIFAQHGMCDACLGHLSVLQQLQVLWVEDPCFTGTGFSHLSPLSQLTVLQIETANHRPLNVTSEGLGGLCALQSLRKLELMELQLGNGSLDTFPCLPHLEELKLLSSEPLGDVSVAALAQLPQLHSLVISNILLRKRVSCGFNALDALHVEVRGPTTPEALMMLLPLPRLRTFAAECNDTLLHTVCCQTTLTELQVLRSTSITDMGLLKLSKLSRLQCLKLAWCDTLTGTTLAALTHLTRLDMEGRFCINMDAVLASLTSLVHLQQFTIYEHGHTGMEQQQQSYVSDRGFVALTCQASRIACPERDSHCPSKRSTHEPCTAFPCMGIHAHSRSNGLLADGTAPLHSHPLLSPSLTDTHTSSPPSHCLPLPTPHWGPPLRHVSLIKLSGITDLSLLCLADCPTLRSLKVFCCSAITNTGLAAVAKKPYILHLEVKDCPRTDGKELWQLLRLLERLDLQFVYCS